MNSLARSVGGFLRAVLRALATAVVVPLLLFEQWGWEPLAALVARLSRLPFWASLEDRLRRLPPWGALLAFFVPVVLLLPVKVLALFLFGNGHAASALTVLVLAKLVGTALVARIFQLVEAAADAHSLVRSLVSALEGMEGPRLRVGATKPPVADGAGHQPARRARLAEVAGELT
jgi:hypothetical protein